MIMGSTVSVNGNTFEEKGGKLYLNGAEISTDSYVSVGFQWLPLVMSFFVGFAASGLLHKFAV
jgi:hypothetical protein